jgi:hypothetical protein
MKSSFLTPREYITFLKKWDCSFNKIVLTLISEWDFSHKSPVIMSNLERADRILKIYQESDQWLNSPIFNKNGYTLFTHSGNQYEFIFIEYKDNVQGVLVHYNQESSLSQFFTDNVIVEGENIHIIQSHENHLDMRADEIIENNLEKSLLLAKKDFLLVDKIETKIEGIFHKISYRRYIKGQDVKIWSETTSLSFAKQPCGCFVPIQKSYKIASK